MSMKRKAVFGDEDESSTKQQRTVSPWSLEDAPDNGAGDAASQETPARPKPCTTVSEFYKQKSRTPPKGSEDVPMDNDFLTGKVARKLLGCTFYECDDVEKQLRFTFIMLKGYKEILNKLYALDSPFEPVLSKAGLQSPMDAMQKSLQKDTSCGIRLGRLIHLGGDVVIDNCRRDDLSSCIETYDEFTVKNAVWQNSKTSVFRQLGEGGGRVEPFLRLQTKESDLCYLIQGSNAIDYHLQMRQLRVDRCIKPFRLNNARHIRNFFTAEASCKHIYAGNGGSSNQVLLDILRSCNPNVSDDNDLLIHCSIYKDSQESFQDAVSLLYTNLKRHLNISGPGIFDMKCFEQFEKKGITKHVGDFSTKNSKHGKHTLLLVDIRESTAADESNGGGYFALFQNTWENRPIWVEMGFDLLLSMEGVCYFIKGGLKFNKEVDAADKRDSVLAQSSSPPPFADFSRYANDKTLLQLHVCTGTEDDEEDVADELTSKDAGSVTETSVSFDLPDSFEKFDYKPNTFYRDA